MKCWEWGGALSKGYGRIWIAGKTLLVHRVAYEAIIGPIPAGLQIDHLCRNRACYNPEHLEAVTPKENTRRGKHGSQTHCPKGHPYSGRNLIITKQRGGYIRRECRVCHNAIRNRSRRKANEIQIHI